MSDAAILTNDEMGKADRFAAQNGVPGTRLMENAGRGVADAIRARWAPRETVVLCGPGDNGGDGFVAARHLKAAGWKVGVFCLGPVGELEGDAARAAARWDGEVGALEDAEIPDGGLVVDALFGAGLSRPLEGAAKRLAQASAGHRAVVVCIDVPSGLSGDAARPDGPVFAADLTVTFHRHKPAHLLQPGARICGEVVLVDIAIPDGWTRAAEPCAELNSPSLWRVPGLDIHPDAHKHRRGRLCVLSGPAGASGAARIAAEAGLKGGAGFVTLLCPPSALMEVSTASLDVVTRAFDRGAGFDAVLKNHRADAAILGPGAGVNDSTRARVLSALSLKIPLVLDADAMTAFEADPETLLEALHEDAVLTPHAGEFDRIFPGLREGSLNKIEAARAAAGRSGAIVLLKGPDTVIAGPDGRVRVNVHASARLATAGTGDALAGLLGAFMAQGEDAFDAACAAAFVHGEAGRRMGPGETARDLLARLPAALAGVRDRRAREAALRRLAARSR